MRSAECGMFAPEWGSRGPAFVPNFGAASEDENEEEAEELREVWEEGE